MPQTPLIWVTFKETFRSLFLPLKKLASLIRPCNVTALQKVIFNEKGNNNIVGKVASLLVYFCFSHTQESQVVLIGGFFKVGDLTEILLYHN